MNVPDVPAYVLTPANRLIPANHNVTGTCGRCGGPVIQPMVWASSGVGYSPPPAEHCMDCGARARPSIPAAHGPLREMTDD